MYSRVRKSTLGLDGGSEQIAIIRASGNISRTRSPLTITGSGIIAEQLIEKIRSVRGLFTGLGFLCLSNDEMLLIVLLSDLKIRKTFTVVR